MSNETMDTPSSSSMETNQQLAVVEHDNNNEQVSLAELGRIIECNSQDENEYPAIGLLNCTGSWRTDSWVDKATVTIQTKDQVYVKGFKIISDGAAFVEIYVSRSNDNLAADDKPKYRMLLSRSSLMTPLQSSPKKFESFRLKEREFDYDLLHEEARKQKWDLFKFVCSQTFNKDVTFGLKNIRIIIQDENSVLAEDTPRPSLDLGKFRLREPKETCKEDFKVGSFFAKRQRNHTLIESTADSGLEQGTSSKRLATNANNITKRDPPLDVGASARPINDTQTGKHDRTETDRPVLNLPFPLSYDNSNDSRDTHESIVCDVKPVIHDTSDDTSNHVGWVGQTSNSGIYTPNPPPRTRTKIYPKVLPQNRILTGVVFVLSGYVNPHRGQIRDLAITMGASYEIDWNPRCTHLICAFKNTPKFKQVISLGGRILREHWITDCSREKKLLDWRDYKLGNYPYPDSEEEDDSIISPFR